MIVYQRVVGFGVGLGEETSCFQEALEGQGATTVGPRRGCDRCRAFNGARNGDNGLGLFFFSIFLGGEFEKTRKKGQKSETTAN